MIVAVDGPTATQPGNGISEKSSKCHINTLTARDLNTLTVIDYVMVFFCLQQLSVLEC